MGHSNINLAALVGSRICHNLISPIGAINNGLELLGMAHARSGPEMDLIQDSVGNASARIRFFRVAFGAAGTQMMGRSEVVSILNDLSHGGRMTIAWGPMDAQSRIEVRLAFLGLQCLETAMPYGGRIEISKDNNQWLLHGRADKLNMDESLWDVLTKNDAPSDIKPAHVQFALMPLIASDTGRKIVTEAEPTEIKLRF